MSTTPLHVLGLIDSWAAHYFLEHDSYRFSVRNTTTNQGAEWPVPHYVVDTVTRLFAMNPDRVEHQYDQTTLHHSVIFEFATNTHPTVKCIVITLAVPESSFRVSARLQSGGQYENSFASEGSIASFLTLFDRARQTNASIGYSPNEKRINFNF